MCCELTLYTVKEPHERRRFYHRTVLQDRRRLAQLSPTPQAILSLGELAAIGVLHPMKNVSRFLAQPTVLGVADS